jgi:hypothetical protein
MVRGKGGGYRREGKSWNRGRLLKTADYKILHRFYDLSVSLRHINAQVSALYIKMLLY